MTMIYDPIPFVKTRSKNFSWKLRAYYAFLPENINN